MPDKAYVMKIEMDLDVYNELQAICALHGTTIESATESFIRFSADPRNIGLLTKYLYAMERIYDIGLSHHLHIQKCDKGYRYTLYDMLTKKAIDGGVLIHEDAEMEHILRIVCQKHGLDHRKAIHAPYTLIEELHRAQDAAFQAAMGRQKIVKNITFEEVGEADGVHPESAASQSLL